MSDEKNKQLFLQLVYSFQMQTMMMLGKLVNPMTGKIERELDGAQATIDMLDMLKTRTVNNIEADESRFLEQVIADLKLNYVEEKEKKVPEVSENKTEELPEEKSKGESTSETDETKS